MAGPGLAAALRPGQPCYRRPNQARQRSKAACPRTQVILMTGFGYDPNHSIVRSTQEGLHCFLFKPFQAQHLVDEVRKAVAEWKGERPLAEGR